MINQLPKNSNQRLVLNKNDFLVEIENHHELFELGKKFLQQHESGISMFGFSSLGHEMGQKRTILGLACYFDYHSIGRVAILSDSFATELYGEIIECSTNTHLEIKKNILLPIKIFGDRLDLIDISKFEQTGALKGPSLAKALATKYDVILCDLPSWDVLKHSIEKYLSLILSVQSLSVVVTSSLAKTDEIEKVSHFFKNYGLNLDGFILDGYKS